MTSVGLAGTIGAPTTPMPPPMEVSKRVLLVEDDMQIAEVLSLHLRDEGFHVEHAANGHLALACLSTATWDALVLDLMMPGVDGLEVCRQARALPHYIPIIMISARSSEVHRIVGLELGADDYLAKPFSTLELVARVKALIRRTDATRKLRDSDPGLIQNQGLMLNPLTREASLHAKPLDLTPREFDLLYFFARHPDKVFSRLDLLNQVWGYEHDGYEHTVNTHINRLRSKVEVDPARPTRILTVWGVGYKFAS